VVSSIGRAGAAIPLEHSATSVSQEIIALKSSIFGLLKQTGQILFSEISICKIDGWPGVGSSL
jgi:hypothetical protein